MIFQIKLPKAIYYYDTDEPLGEPGGFGEVFLGRDESGKECAIKKLKIEAEKSSFREQRIASLLEEHDFNHVIKILDTGQDSDTGNTFVVMEKAEMSLQAVIDERGHLHETEAVNILIEITEGLLEVSEFVHRDLKPSNILLQNGKWKIADFGIARFVEESTSLQTLKECLTYPYAAPEQWKFKTSTHATDIYAIGCIGYCLLTGSPPYKATTVEDYQQQHLYSNPPVLENFDPRLISIVTQMLRKSPSVRPKIEKVKEILTNINSAIAGSDINSGEIKLATAGKKVAQRISEQEVEEKKTQEKLQKRQTIAIEADKIFVELINELANRISKALPNITGFNGHRLICENIVLEVKPEIDLSSFYIPENSFEQSGWDVIAGEYMVLSQIKPKYIYSANFWYMKLDDKEGHRWYEVSYRDFPRSGEVTKDEPFYLPNTSDADLAASQVLSEYLLAFGPEPIDMDKTEEFYNRWMSLIAKALEGRLSYPIMLPLTYDYFQ